MYISTYANLLHYVAHFKYRKQVGVISNLRVWGSDRERHKGIKDISERFGQQLCGGSATSMRLGGLASNQSGFDVY